MPRTKASGHPWFKLILTAKPTENGPPNGGNGRWPSRRMLIRPTSFTMPQCKALFFPVMTVIDDNTDCPPYKNPLLTADQLAAQAADIWTAVSRTTCTIDGVPVEGLDDPQHTHYRVQSPAFSYTVASHNNLLAAIFDGPCIPDGITVSPAVSDGAFLMLVPLSVGHHTIHFVGVVGPVATPFFFKDITYNITVAPGNGGGEDRD
jgi:hypothetical protein